MSEGPARNERRKKKGEGLEPQYNPELEKTINQYVSRLDIPKPKGWEEDIKKPTTSKELGGELGEKLFGFILPREKKNKKNIEETVDSEPLQEHVKPAIESLPEDEFQKLLDATAHTQPSLEDFKGILDKAKANGDHDVFHDQLERIGIAAAKRLGGHEYNAFKKYVVDNYELNDADVAAITPELDFLRGTPKERYVREKEVDEVQLPATIEHSEAQVPENLPLGSPEERLQITDSRATRFQLPYMPGAGVPAVVEAKSGEVIPFSPGGEVVAHVADSNVIDIESEPVLTSGGGALILKQEGYLANPPIPTLEGTWEHIEEPTTPKEWKEKLRELISSKGKESEKIDDNDTETEKKTEENAEQTVNFERLQENLAQRSEELQEKAKEQGPKVLEIIGSVVERYNKLHWATKLAVTGTLTLGVFFTASALPVVAGALSTALYGQRVLGAVGFGMNKRKKLDAKIAANPEHWLAGKSELAKNTYAAALAAVYMGSTAFAVHEGVEGLKAAADSDWLANMLGHYGYGAKPTLNNPPAPETFPSGAPKGIPDTAEFEESVDPSLMAEGKDLQSLRVLAEQSLSKHLTKNEWAVLNNHIASLTPRERSFFDQFTAEHSNQINAGNSEGHSEWYNVLDPRVDDDIAKAQVTVGRMQELVEEQKKILDTMPDGSETPTSDLHTSEESIPIPEQDQAQTDDVPAPEKTVPEGKIGADRMFDAEERVEKGLPPGESGKFTGLEHPGGMSDVEKATKYPGPDVFPKPAEEKGFFQNISDWFNGEKETVDESSSKAALSENATDATHLETNAAGLAVDATHAQAYLDAEGNKIIFGGSLKERAEAALTLVSKDHSAVVFYDSTPPSNLFGVRTPQLSRMFWLEGAGQTIDPVAPADIKVGEAVIQGVQGQPLPSIDDLKEVYKPVKK